MKYSFGGKNEKFHSKFSAQPSLMKFVKIKQAVLDFQDSLFLFKNKPKVKFLITKAKIS